MAPPSLFTLVDSNSIQPLTDHDCCGQVRGSMQLSVRCTVRSAQITNVIESEMTAASSQTVLLRSMDLPVNQRYSTSHATGIVIPNWWAN